MFCVFTHRGLSECPLALLEYGSTLVNNTCSPVSVPSWGFYGTVWTHSWSHLCSFTSFLYFSFNLFCYIPVFYLMVTIVFSSVSAQCFGCWSSHQTHVCAHRHAHTFFQIFYSIWSVFLILVLFFFMLFFLLWILVLPLSNIFLYGLRFSLIYGSHKHNSSFMASANSPLSVACHSYGRRLLSSSLWGPDCLLLQKALPFPYQRGSARAVLPWMAWFPCIGSAVNVAQVRGISGSSCLFLQPLCRTPKVSFLLCPSRVWYCLWRWGFF